MLRLGLLIPFLYVLYLSASSQAFSIPTYPLTTLPLTALLNNRASADFDGHGGRYDAEYLPNAPRWTYDGIMYDIADHSGNDNVIADGQTLMLTNSTFVNELHFLYAGDASGNEFVGNFILNFDDNSTQTVQLYAKNWFSWPNLNVGASTAPYHFENATKNFNATHVYQWSTSVFSERPLASITFPANNPAHRLHVFALSVTPSSPSTTNIAEMNPNIPIRIRRVRFTTKWENVQTGGKTERGQIVEVTLANILPSFTLSMNTTLMSATVALEGNGISTLKSGTLHRLVPGDQARVDVLVSGSQKGKSASVQVSFAGTVLDSDSWKMEELVQEWTESELGRHETPNWWNNAKFGIFIHWGVYSVPAWAPPSVYAEWYDWNYHNPPDESNPSWEHHLQTYGPNVVYDDFISNFTASKFDPSAWIDLFDKAGAKYFVFVTKHHDGFALFDTLNTTHRSSVYLGPKRDFLKELMDTAKKEKPSMRRGTYYSLPEWFNPSYAKYGFAQWPGGLARNAFNSSVLEPYTGYLSIDDYVKDLQYEHMKRIAEVYNSDIMWCDIGGPNNTVQFAAEYYNHAQQQGREVTINNRCGAVPDFDTPEYATFGSIQPRAWESNEGMDPLSYGLNSATQPGQYMNGSTIVRTLVDIVSKGGNFLLDVGPNAEGEIIDAMKNNLMDAGKWLVYNERCIYNTSYWYTTPQDPTNPNTHFVTTPTTFCVISLSAPENGKVTVGKRIPIMDGDKVILLQPDGETEIQWQRTEHGGVVLNVGVNDDGRYAWGFEVQYA